MGWFDEQIKQRIKNDNEEMCNANIRLMSVVMGEQVLFDVTGDDNEAKALNEIERFYNVNTIKKLRQRSVVLSDKWHEECVGALLGKKTNGEAIALIPMKSGRYSYFDYSTKRQVRVDSHSPIQKEAVSFYKELPAKSVEVSDLFRFLLEQLTFRDIFSFLLLSVGIVLVGLLFPYINYVIFSSLIFTESSRLFVGVAFLFFAATFSYSLLSICRSMALSRIQMKLNIYLAPAVFGRLLSLPAQFFRRYSAGELAQRSNSVLDLCHLIVISLLGASVSLVLSLIYLYQIQQIIPALVLPCVLTLAVIMILNMVYASVSMVVTRRNMEASSKLSGFLFSILSGIQKIKLTGSEKRVYARWAELYREKATYEYDLPLIMKITAPLTVCITMLSTVVFYLIAAHHHVSAADYIGFSVSFGLLSGTLLSFNNVIVSLARIRPTLEMARPILDTEPEISEERIEVKNLQGNISVSRLTFKYNPSQPPLLKDVSIKIKAGEFVAIVGKTGCGKSTLLRLLLGFEKPQSGIIAYDGVDMNRLDLRSLRRKVGVILQNDKLFASDILSNIRITNPDLTIDDAWRAAKIANIDKEIEQLPMGMFSYISEGGGGFSGGQKQRLIIARAVANSPSVLLFDEATSALDNVTQSLVTKSLNEMKCTRVIVAHRLSTVRNCDRIFVLHEGEIVEEGKYEELIGKQGFFAELVKRQL